MFKFRSISQFTRRAGIALALVVSLGATLLPTVAMAAPLAGQYGHGGPGCANYYIVQKGDTLSGIAARYGVGLWSLRDANGIGNANRIYAGQHICITGGYQHGGYNQHYQGNHQNYYPGNQYGGYNQHYQGNHQNYYPGNQYGGYNQHHYQGGQYGGYQGGYYGGH